MEGGSGIGTPVLKAARVYLLMGKKHRVSRNRRAEWFFANLNGTITVKPKYKLEDSTDELDVLSVIPKDPPPSWSIEASHLFRYLICSDTVVDILSRKYRIVFCVDVSPSIGSVDVQTGMVTFDAMFHILQNTMEGLVKPFYVPGSHLIFQPKIYVTVLAHAPFISSFIEEVLIQGVLLDSLTCKCVLQKVFQGLSELENKLAIMSAKLGHITDEHLCNPNICQASNTDTDTSEKSEKNLESTSQPSLLLSSDFGLVDLLRHALIAVNLLPENSVSGIIVLTDGVISVPDGGYLDMVLSQFRYSTVSCSFIQLSSPFHPHTSFGILPYLDLLRFIATATFGAFLTTLPRVELDSQAMNPYHKSFLTWSFQDPIDGIKNSPLGNRPGEWSVQNKCFSLIRDMPVVKKQQYETTLNIDYIKILSCRLREGFTIKDARIGSDNLLQVKLVLPWKFLIVIEYILITQWPPSSSVSQHPKLRCIVSLEGPYDFLHDVTCLAKKPFQSYYRQLLVNKFWASQLHLSESDKLLSHFSSFNSNAAYYTIPERLRNGLPLFQISSNSSTPTFQSSDSFPHFSQFWKPACLLDTEIWQKWMHTHRIGVLLEHDHPLPKHIHLPNPSGRFHVIQCRQTMMALNTLLKDWSSFVLVENHSYIKLVYRENDRPPFSFCIVRVTTKPPCVILRLAFLVGTPGESRQKELIDLKERILGLTFPQRLNEPPKWRVPSGNSLSTNLSRGCKRTWADVPCCVILYKPIDKILLRYEQLPRNFGKCLLPQSAYNSSWTTNRKTTMNHSTFGFRPTYSTPWGAPVKMGPEMFNTVARYLNHRRWIWCVQSGTDYPITQDCVGRILSTLTKMRLQEGLRFAYSSGGIVSMIIELELMNEKLGICNSELESIDNMEDYDRTTSILQYVMFPPVTNLISYTDEDDVDEDLQTSEENSDLFFIITECWLEPQYGKVLSSAESQSFYGLEYQTISKKIYEMDQECILSLITFEHLSIMSQSNEIPSPAELNESLRSTSFLPVDPLEDNIQFVPFSCELKRILPKCTQAEYLFSMFNQDLSISYPVGNYCPNPTFPDRSNSILFDSWLSNILHLHDREVLLGNGDHQILFELITTRQRPLPDGEVPFAEHTLGKIDTDDYPKWKCFIKGFSSTHFLLTLTPASYYDLKLLMLSAESLLKKGDVRNRAVYILPMDEGMDESFTSTTPLTPQGDRNRSTAEDDENGNEGTFVKSEIRYHQKTPSGGNGNRKRNRVKSGEEICSGSSKTLNRKCSLDNLFRCRTNSVEAAWKAKKLGKMPSSPDPNDCTSCVLSIRKDSEQTESQFTYDQSVFETGMEHKVNYGSITFPLYVYDCSLPTITEHVIFRTSAGTEDIFMDYRVCSKGEIVPYPVTIQKEVNSNHNHSSPEPRPEDQDFVPTNEETLQNHCRTLEVGFAKSYVHGLFQSLQSGYYVHKNDVQEAIRLCRESTIEINLTEFIQTVCQHVKEVQYRRKTGDGSPKRIFTSCEELKSIHAFIKRRFNHSILSVFDWVIDSPGIFYYKIPQDTKTRNASGVSMDSSKQTSVEGEFVGKTSFDNFANSESLDNSNDAPKSAEVEPILNPDYFSLDDNLPDGGSSEDEASESVPLFLYLACTYIDGDLSSSFLVHDIPSCLDEIIEALGEDFGEVGLQDNFQLILEFVFLTVPQEVEEVDYRIAGAIRTSSMCSISPLPRRGELGIAFSRDQDPSFSSLQGDYSGKAYPSSLAPRQYSRVKSVVEDVKWLLKDEITSFRWESFPLSELSLTLVAAHVEKSLNKPGCECTLIPLNFVQNQTLIGYEKFKERFRICTLDGYELKEEGSLFYLVPVKPITGNRNRVPAMAQFKECREEGSSLASDSYQHHGEADVAYGTEAVDIVTPRKKICVPLDESGRGSAVESAHVHYGLDVPRSQQTDATYLTTPSQLSEISSIVESSNTNEDGYEGDGSDSTEDSVKLELDVRRRSIPPFWILCRISPEQVAVYFHTRFDENNAVLFEYLVTLRNKVIRVIRQLRRVVNQDLLLQQLHDSRECSNLIEPRNASSDYENQLHYAPPIVKRRIENLESEIQDPKQFPSGYFSCDVVWETKFLLHSRLRTGPGKSLVSQGIYTLQGTLTAFRVNNRQNMFVYRDRTGNVFYLRLYRIGERFMEASSQQFEDIETGTPTQLPKGSHGEGNFLSGNRDTWETHVSSQSERPNDSTVLLRVHGITEAGDEIKESLVQSLRNKLDDAVLEILSVTLDRTPHCKLTQEDVAFIQKPNSTPDAMLKFYISLYACQHLAAFAYYLHQNLLQWFILPKYTETKAECHFRDFGEDVGENEGGTIYLYNQRPGGTGSRGIACVLVSIVDSIAQKRISKASEWRRPESDAWKTEFSETDYDGRVKVEEVGNTGANSNHLSPLVVELRMWKQGRINLDLLKTYLSSAIRHASWDLTMEFYFLTAPLSCGPDVSDENLEFTFSFSAPSTPKSGGILYEHKSETLESSHRRRIGGGSGAILESRIRPILELENLEFIDTRCRSMSVTVRKVSGGQEIRLNQGRASSPMVFPFPNQGISKGRLSLSPTLVGVSRAEAGDVGHLHQIYDQEILNWCEFGSKFNVPSLRSLTIELSPHQHPVEILVLEIEKLVQQLIPEYEPKQFWLIRGEANEFQAGGLRILSEARNLSRINAETELKVLQSHLKGLVETQTKELEYPEELQLLFKEAENFHPSESGDSCILISRNLIHWKFCIGSGAEPQFYMPEAYKNQYKFSPLISAGWDQQATSSSFMSLEKLPRVASGTGLSCLVNEPESNLHPILIPRQRLLLARITNSKISYCFYNWSKEVADRLIDSTKLLAHWINARYCVLSSINSQKSGLFQNQAINRMALTKGLDEYNPFTCGSVDVETLLKFLNPPKEFLGVSRTSIGKKAKSGKTLLTFNDVFRNLKHQVTLFRVPGLAPDTFKQSEEQLLQIRLSEKTEAKSTLFQYWLSRGPSASNVIGVDGIQAFKQAARTLHYCLTPIIFLPRWRSEIASTRDSSIGTLRKSRNQGDPKQYCVYQLGSDASGDRSRHDSGTSQRSVDSASTSKGRGKSYFWGSLWHNSSSQLNQESQSSSVNQSMTNLSMSGRRAEEKWHTLLCDSFIQEYLQYLQTLGFIPIQSKTPAAKKVVQGKESEPERLRHVSGASILSSGSSQSGNSMGVTFNNFSRRVRADSGGSEERIFYLQKSLPGGIILFEVGLSEPFFYSKIHTLEATRIQSRKSRRGFGYKNVLDFVYECEKMKLLMHLHSFTYDFHLRSIHSFILGRQMPFKPGYHVTNFLDDFIKYYPKGPNFARNTVYVGMLRIENVSTASTLLFDYMLDKEKKYNMRVIKMSSDRANDPNVATYQCKCLVDLSSKKIVYRDRDYAPRLDEFDVTLLIAHDFPLGYSGDPSVLRLKYYIILTSRRELYPKGFEEIGDGKMNLVNTPEPLSFSRELEIRNSAAGSRSVKYAKGTVEDRNQLELETDPCLNTEFAGIKEESVHYMGYFSSHESMMKRIVSERIGWVEDRIRDLVGKASVDCRRDLLWQRLLVGSRDRKKKEDLISRETSGRLTYWEFGELLELVYVKSLSEMDRRLACLLRQPVAFYQSLLDLITQGSMLKYRYFASTDKSTHHMALFSPLKDPISGKSTKHVVMLDINLDKRTADLSILFKEKNDPSGPLELEPEILNLIESVVNVCCYCWWWWSSVNPI